MRSGKIVLVHIGWAMVATLIAAIISLYSIQSSFRHITADALQTVRDSTHQAVRSWAQENEHHIKILSRDPYLLSLVEDLLAVHRTPEALLDSPAQQLVRDYLNPIVGGHEMRGFFIIAPDNISLASSRDQNTGTPNLLNTLPDFVHRLWAGDTIVTLPQPSDVPLPDIEGKLIDHYPTMFVGSPIYNNDQQIIALLTLRLDPKQNLEKIIRRGRIGQTGETYLIDREGYMLTESRFDERLWSKHILQNNGQSTFHVKIIDPTDIANPELAAKPTRFTKMAASVLLGQTGFDVIGYRDYRGEMVTGAWLWDEKYSFGLATELDYDEAFYPYEKTKQSFIAFSGAAILFFGIITVLLIRFQRRIQSHEVQFRSLFENASDPTLIVAYPSGNILSANNLAFQFFGYSNTELIGLHVSRLKPNITSHKAAEDIDKVVRLGQTLVETEYQTKQGKIIPIEASAKLVPYGEQQAIIVILRDITFRKNTERKLIEMANTDMLTRLSNRASFDASLKQYLSDAGQNGQLLALLFFDVDDFRIINDTQGHIIGDQVLQGVARLITEAITPQARAFRFGGDEFTVIAPIANEKEAQRICQAIINAFKRPIIAGDNEIHLAISAGIAIAPRDGEEVTVLLHSANTALYAAKRQGRNRYEFFSEEMRIHDTLLLNISKALIHALENKEFFLVFQPVVLSTTGELIGAEALLRWRTKELGMIGPDIFIPIAEQTGRINEIGSWVLDEACRTLAQWRARGFADIKLSINLSPVQMVSANIPRLVSNVLDKYELDPHLIALEVTEGVLIENREEISQQLNALSMLNVSLYLDDFGTGYSSLSYLSKYPFSVVKLDRSFVMDLEEKSTSRSLAKTVISMASSLNMTVIAEGVETQWQSDFLKENGCHKIQGYLYGKPVVSEEFFQTWKGKSLSNVVLLSSV